MNSLQRTAYNFLQFLRTRNDNVIDEKIREFMLGNLSKTNFLREFNSISLNNRSFQTKDNLKASIRRCYNELLKVPSELTIDELNSVNLIKEAYKNFRIDIENIEFEDRLMRNGRIFHSIKITIIRPNQISIAKQLVLIKLRNVYPRLPSQFRLNNTIKAKQNGNFIFHTNNMDFSGRIGYRQKREYPISRFIGINSEIIDLNINWLNSKPSIEFEGFIHLIFWITDN